jgi:hypothetical protein
MDGVIFWQFLATFISFEVISIIKMSFLLRKFIGSKLVFQGCMSIG